jgi:hypothetical protein
MNDLRLRQVAIILGIIKAAIGFTLLTKYSYNKNNFITEGKF